MLDQAMEGEFLESRYDESELSRLETRWKQYLSASRQSAREIQEERQNLQSLVGGLQVKNFLTYLV